MLTAMFHSLTAMLHFSTVWVLISTMIRCNNIDLVFRRAIELEGIVFMQCFMRRKDAELLIKGFLIFQKLS